ncbi:S1C family serine protease [Nocardioides sambongensis]|uniref:S1C family serine protease n=1 Tax=Nocardioides sambongensis TaxID=2589074 RepID=UPI00112AA9F0|nr:trypsin-like peptidase domain-containing protein [Nocardioides sambongensis]
MPDQPPPPPPFSPYAAPVPESQIGAQPHRRSTRWGAVAAAGALGAVVALGVGGAAGWMVGRNSATPSDTGAASAPAADGRGTVPGAPWGGTGGQSDGGSVPELPDDWSGQQPMAGDASAGQTDATDEQETGVVLVESTLTNGSGAGTGFVIDEDGTVVTNYHVVEGSTALRVTIASTGAVYDAEVLGSNETADIALLQLTGAQGLDEVVLDDDGVQVGEAVTTIGNSEGQGYLSAASGSVVGLDEDITTSDQLTSGTNDLSGLIVNDVYAVSGDSGGPLVDADGEVVGVTTATTTGGQTRSYAVPIDDALAVVETIESGVETSSTRIGPNAYLGVSITGAENGGVSVAEATEGGPAAAAGITAGDTITAFDGVAVSEPGELSGAVADHEPGESATVTWVDTSGAEQTATVALGESPIA